MTEIRRKLEKNLSSDCYQHTFGATYTVAALAMRYQASIKDTEPARLLHDYVKEHDKRESFSAAEKSGIRSPAADMTVPQIWHAITGSVVVEKRYGVAKLEILSVTCRHTTGRREVSLSEKIIFTVDYIESDCNRADSLAEMRYLAFQNLDFCVHRITADTSRYLASKQIRADQRTEEYYQWLKEVKEYDDE